MNLSFIKKLLCYFVSFEKNIRRKVDSRRYDDINTYGIFFPASRIVVDKVFELSHYILIHMLNQEEAASTSESSNGGQCQKKTTPAEQLLSLIKIRCTNCRLPLKNASGCVCSSSTIFVKYFLALPSGENIGTLQSLQIYLLTTTV